MSAAKKSSRRRIPDDELQVSGINVNVACPICGRKSWFHRFVSIVSDKQGSRVARVSWKPEALELHPMRRWPRKPDGSAGFYWERFGQADFAKRFPAVVGGVQSALIHRMLSWLRVMGIDVSLAHGGESKNRETEGADPKGD